MYGDVRDGCDDREARAALAVLTMTLGFVQVAPANATEIRGS
jgi:hypothetical protein